MRVNATRSSAPTVVAVNEAIIASADIAREVQNHEGISAMAAWTAATRALVVRQLLAQRARMLGLVAEPRSANGLREPTKVQKKRQIKISSNNCTFAP